MLRGPGTADMSRGWSVDALPWDRLCPGRVEAALLETVKTAALVEANSADYVTYLCNVFPDDAAFREAAEIWGVEEAQHGEALGRWAERIDPHFNFAASLAQFRAGYQLPLDAQASVRGSRAGELVARCVVESGTCSFYSALRDSTTEPVLKQICHSIAQDEAGHYQLFRLHLKRYLKGQPLSFGARLRIALGRVQETGDDELAYAYYAANVWPTGERVPYNRKACADAYWQRAMARYQQRHVLSAARMIATAVDLSPGRRWLTWLASALWRVLQWRLGRMQAA